MSTFGETRVIADHGPITFKGISVMRAKSDFLRVRLNEDSALGGEVARFALDEWRMKAPGMLLRVTGSMPERGMMDTDLSDIVDEIMEDLFRAAGASNAWIITQGLDYGIAKVVGQALSRLTGSAQAPLIGVADWETVDQSYQLLANHKDAQKSVSSPGAKRVYCGVDPDHTPATEPLEPHHRAYFLVGGTTFANELKTNKPTAGSGSANLNEWWRSASKVEAELASIMQSDCLGNESRVPRVVLVLGGDAATLQEIIHFLSDGDSDVDRGVVVLASDSGALASALADYLNAAVIPPEWSAHKDVFAKVDFYAKQSPPRIFQSTVGGRTDLFEDCLEAMMAQANDFVGRISQCVFWDDAQRLKTEISIMPSWSKDRPRVLAAVLQHSLELQHVDCVRVALENAAPVKAVQLFTLYDQLFDTEDPPRFYLFEGKRKPSEVRASTPDGYVKLEEDQDADSDHDRAMQLIAETYPKDAWVLIQEVIPGLCRYWKTKATKFINDEKNKGQTPEDETSARDEEQLDVKIGCRVLDVYVWAVLLGNTELALALLPFTQEPIRAAIIGTTLCMHMMQKIPLEKVALEEAREVHERFAIDLLELCVTFMDARRMLTTKSQLWKRTVVEMAVQANMMSFCQHRYPQTLCDEMLRGNTEFGVSVVLENSLSKGGLGAAMQVIFHAAVPLPLPGIFLVTKPENRLHSPLALGWCKHQTSYLTEEELSAGGQGPLKLMDFYDIPLVRQLVRLFAYFLFVLLFSTVVIKRQFDSPEEGDFILVAHPIFEFEVVILGIWTVGLCFDEWYKWASDAATFNFDFWTKYDYCVFSLTLIGLAAGLVSEDHKFAILQPTAILVWCRMLKFLQLSESVGVLVIMIMAMFKDIALWGLVSTIFTIAFTVSFVANSSGPVSETVVMPIWAMLGQYDVDAVGETSALGPVMGQSMLWLYVVVSNIVLVNLLIAMMGDTYGTIKENSDAEFKIGRLRTVLNCEKQMHPIPPPFNLPWTLPAFWRQRGQPIIDRVDDAHLWEREGTLWKAKREKDFIARDLLRRMKLKIAEDAEQGRQMERMDDKIKGIESTLEGFKSTLTKIESGLNGGGKQRRPSVPSKAQQPAQAQVPPLSSRMTPRMPAALVPSARRHKPTEASPRLDDAYSV